MFAIMEIDLGPKIFGAWREARSPALRDDGKQTYVQQNRTEMNRQPQSP